MKKLLASSFSGLVLLAGLTGCGGDDDSASTTISGSAVKGPVAGAKVKIKKASTGDIVGETTTKADGTYTLNVPYTGDVIVEVVDGTYTDEATGQTTTLAAPMKVVVAANGSPVKGMVTPLTTMAFTQAFGAVGSGAAVKSADFNAMASKVATQFKLSGVDLATSEPVVSGAANAYGQALKGVSKYLATQGTVTPAQIAAAQTALLNTKWDAAKWTAFSGTYAAAYNNINGTNISYSFDGSTLTITGTGAGGGTGKCGIQMSGTVTAAGYSVPFSQNICYTGLPAESCNNSYAPDLSTYKNVPGLSNFTYKVSTTCAAGAMQVNLN